MKVKLIIITLVILGFSLKAQNTVRFNKQYDFFDTNASTSGYLSVNAFKINNDYLVCGVVTTPTINQGLGIIRLDSVGNIKYQKQTPSPNNFSFTNNTANQSYIKLKNNNLLYSGQYDVALDHARACLAKINHKTGDTIWTKTYTQVSDTCFLLCTTELNDSSLLVFGFRYNTCITCNNNSKPFMMKVDKNGMYKWHKYINANFSSTDYLYQKIIKINDNVFIVIGYKYNNICYPQSFIMRIDTNAVQVPPLLIQPFVENSIWHGLNNKPQRGTITISITKQENMLKYCIVDDGVKTTLPDQQLAISVKKKSLGMSLTKERLDVLNRVKGTNAGFTVTDILDDMKNYSGKRVELLLPYITDV